MSPCEEKKRWSDGEKLRTARGINCGQGYRRFFQVPIRQAQ